MCYPRTFSEFYQDHPHFVRQLIHKNRWTKFGEADDLEQEILSELIRKKTVEKFNPAVYDQEVNIPIFMSYIKTCVERLYATTRMHDNAVKRIVNSDPVSLSTPLPDADEGTLTLLDGLHDDGRATGQLEAIAELSNLSSYITTNHPDLTDIMAAIRRHGTLNTRDLAQHTGMMRSHVTSRLAKLLRVVRSRR